MHPTCSLRRLSRVNTYLTISQLSLTRWLIVHRFRVLRSGVMLYVLQKSSLLEPVQSELDQPELDQSNLVLSLRVIDISKRFRPDPATA